MKHKLIVCFFVLSTIFWETHFFSVKYGDITDDMVI